MQAGSSLKRAFRVELAGEASIDPGKSVSFIGEIPADFRIRRLVVEGDPNDQAFITKVAINDRPQYKHQPPRYPGLPCEAMLPDSVFYQSFAPSFGPHNAGDKIMIEIANVGKDSPVTLKVFVED